MNRLFLYPIAIVVLLISIMLLVSTSQNALDILLNAILIIGAVIAGAMNYLYKRMKKNTIKS